MWPCKPFLELRELSQWHPLMSHWLQLCHMYEDTKVENVAKLYKVKSGRLWGEGGGMLHLQSSPQPLQMRISLPRHDLLGEERLTSVSEEKCLVSLSMGFYWVYLHKDAYQRKEVWFTDNISVITGVLLSQGLVERVMPIGCKTLGNKLILCLVP